MDTRSTKIEFKSIAIHSDLEDLSQECAAYMKTKQFLAKRIHQQQEEIEYLKQSVMFHSGKNVQLYEMLKHVNDQIDFIKESMNIKGNKKDKLDLSVEDLASSFIYEENIESNQNKNDKLLNRNKNNIETSPLLQLVKNQTNGDLSILKNENLEMGKEIENLKIELLDKNLELNRVKTDKFILFNELNELIMSLRRTNIDNLNSFFKNNSSKEFTKFDMPSSKGIKLNILSAQSQIGKILNSDSVIKKLNKPTEPTPFLINNTNENYSELDQFDKEKMDSYYNIFKKMEEEFDSILDRKLAKKSKSFLYY